MLIIINVFLFPLSFLIFFLVPNAQNRYKNIPKLKLPSWQAFYENGIMKHQVSCICSRFYDLILMCYILKSHYPQSWFLLTNIYFLLFSSSQIIFCSYYVLCNLTKKIFLSFFNLLYILVHLQEYFKKTLQFYLIRCSSLLRGYQIKKTHK